jgi:hypothetical protein
MKVNPVIFSREDARLSYARGLGGSTVQRIAIAALEQAGAGLATAPEQGPNLPGH